MDTRLLVGLVMLVGLPLSALGQDTLQGPGWMGREVEVSGHVIGWQPRTDPQGGCALVQVDPRNGQAHGRLWACSAKARAEWVLDAHPVRVSGTVSSLQKTRLGAQWRFIPKIDQARVRE